MIHKISEYISEEKLIRELERLQQKSAKIMQRKKSDLFVF